MSAWENICHIHTRDFPQFPLTSALCPPSPCIDRWCYRKASLNRRLNNRLQRYRQRIAIPQTHPIELMVALV